MPQKLYVPPAIETIESSEILEMIGPVQGYGPGAQGTWQRSNQRPDGFFGWRFR